MRNALSWVSVLLLGVACFAPWTQVTTFRGESLLVGAMNDSANGAQYLIVCAIGAAVGLLARRLWITSVSAAAAALLTIVMMYEFPDTMLQFGYQSDLTWGAYLALVSSLVLLFVGRTAVSTSDASARVAR